ncbi:hypothetical protein MPTK1_6g15940 [Marchantia polymorpha subsp. ruderalis]|uniref:Uncharacterized protein n=2 Tax=Marchantia polymorpha TaxID=3197 RepID=A0AAF6BSJ1_MARPO|nr:hypothetical protein MARPO_0056s0106 [Marchantia polymorpha]BBN14975.1 hypothetical protein Mp_6g15940 [Marchantia polymorpha subsp. ruderalis]|eukprot:PTQ37659.1 hypothetical protein MARPO_0056s0106 [Marchantia polymorpha]
MDLRLVARFTARSDYLSDRDHGRDVKRSFVGQCVGTGGIFGTHQAPPVPHRTRQYGTVLYFLPHRSIPTSLGPNRLLQTKDERARFSWRASTYIGRDRSACCVLVLVLGFAQATNRSKHRAEPIPLADELCISLQRSSSSSSSSPSPPPPRYHVVGVGRTTPWHPTRFWSQL